MEKGRGLISRIIVFLILGGIALKLSAQIPNAEKGNQSQVENFYKSFSGMMEEDPIRLDLHFVDRELSGKYHTQDKSIPLEVQTTNKEEGAWILSGKAEDTSKIDKENTWKFWITKENVKGFGFVKKDGDATKIRLIEDYPAGVAQFSMHSYHRTVSIFPDDPESPVYNIELIFPRLKNPSETDSFLNQEIKSILGLKEELSFETGVEELLKDYEKNYKQAISEEFEGEKNVIINDWQFSQVVNIEFNQQGYLVLSDNNQEYSGGAHDYQHKNYWAFDIQNQKPFHLENLTTIDSVQLQDLLETQFRKDFDLRAEQDLDKILFENHLKPTENFKFDKQGIYFSYKPYEVGPYSLQEFEVFIPYQAFHGTLVSEFAKRMNLSGDNVVN